MQRSVRQNAIPVKTLVVLASAVALVAMLVTVVVVSGFGSAHTDPTVLHGRWVRSGEACDTKRGDMVIGLDSFVGHMDGKTALQMKVVSIAQKPSDVLELKLQSYAKPEFIIFLAFTVKDAATIMNGAGIWRKCV